MSWLLAFGGFCALIVLHELGHFTAAKMVGMRVERFALFFPPLLFKVKRGETEYGVGAIPLGGYVRISGMNPNEELPEEVKPRAYYNQPVWKRVFVISAGPFVNLVVAFLILVPLFMHLGKPVEDAKGNAISIPKIESLAKDSPAKGKLEPGDTLISIDGKRGSVDVLRTQIGTHRCAGAQTDKCVAATPATVVVRRDGQLRTIEVFPQYSAKAKRPLVGFSFDYKRQPVDFVEAMDLSVTGMWVVTRETVEILAQLFKPEKRDELSGVVGGYETTRQSFELETSQALLVLAFISLSLAIINLFPFLPLDGGHIFWALAEKVRGKPIPFSIMERASVVGFVLVMFIFVIGLSNDIGRLQGDGFGVTP